MSEWTEYFKDFLGGGGGEERRIRKDARNVL